MRWSRAHSGSPPAAGLRLQAGAGRHAGEGGPGPQQEGLAQQAGGVLVVAGVHRAVAQPREAFELPHVAAAAAGDQQVAAGHGGQDVLGAAPRARGGGIRGGGGGLVQGEGDQFAQLQDVGLQGGADAARGRPDHSSSTRAATGTTRSACSASSARTWRGLGAVGAIDTPFSLTSNVPSTSICTPSPPRWVCAVLRYPEYKTGRTVCQYQTVHAVLMHRAAGHPRSPARAPGLRIRPFPGRAAGKERSGIPAGAGRSGVPGRRAGWPRRGSWTP